MEEASVITYRTTTDAADIYHDGTAIDVARAESAAQDGTLSSFMKNNTVVFSKPVVTPLLLPMIIVGTDDVHKQRTRS
jgi:hypothetical protein